MKWEIAGILFIIQNLLLYEIFLASFFDSTYSLSQKIRMKNVIEKPINYYKNDDASEEISYESSEMGPFSWRSLSTLKETIEINKPHSFKNGHHGNKDFSVTFVRKRNLLSFSGHQNSSLDQEISVESNLHDNISYPSSQDIFHKYIVLSIIPYKTVHHVTDFNKTRSFKNESAAYNSSNDDSDFQGNDVFVSLNNQSSNDWYSPFSSIINIESLLKSLSSRYNRNSSMIFKLNSTDKEMHDILLENFDCIVDETLVLNISCIGVDLYSIGKYLPNDTIILDLSYGDESKLLKPLFPHLKNLKSLSLTHNHHRHITRAFMGLENLEKLVLSYNEIMVFLNAFLYIPKLKSLNLSDNTLTRIRTVSNAIRSLESLENFTLNNNVYINHIKKEDLYNLKNCNISLFSLFNTTLQYEERGSFSFLTNLKILELSVNYLNEQALANVTCGITENVETLFIGQMLRIKEFPIDALKCLENGKVKEVHLWYNYFSNVPMLPSLPYLQFISLSNCSIKEVDKNAFQNTPNIEIIVLRGNKLRHISLSLSSAKNLKKLYIDSQNTDTYKTFRLNDYVFHNLTKLTELSLSRVRLEMLSRYSLYGVRNLHFLYLSQATLYNIEDYAFESLESLEFLDLRGNGLKSLTNFTFYGLKKLEYLYLAGNFITFFESVYPFQFLPSLSIILLQYNQIEFIPEGMFISNENIKLLILGKNKIVPWSKRVLHPKSRIKMLGLSQNNIEFISEVMLHEFNQVTEYLDLGKNPFNCSKCGMKEFQDFCLATNLSLKLPIPQAKDNVYTCMNPQTLQNENFLEVELPEVVCVNTETRLINMIPIILACFFVLLLMCLTLICYAFRWYIRYWIFHIKTDFKRKISHFRENNYVYDAFIIYSSCDTAWVVNHLIPALENQDPQYKLCVHQRDFQVGRQITENILEAIEKSRKAILILTEGFIKSEWCMYELHLAQHKLFGDTRDTLILVKLKAIDKELYSKNLSYIEKTRRCFMWTESHIGQKLFWNKIRKQLGQPSTQQNFQITSKC